MKRTAAIDVGSNSVRLLVAETNGLQIIPIYKTLRTTRLGKGVDAKGFLSPDAVRSTLDAVREFREKAVSMGAGDVSAIATSAVRDASNGKSFMQEVVRLGLEARILDGSQEAEYGFVGAALGCRTSGASLLLADIGGGSTELVLGKGLEIQRVLSLDIGAVRLTERFVRSDPPHRTDLKKIEHFVMDILAQDAKDITVGNTEMVGVGGTITSLAAIAQCMEFYDSKRIHGYILTLGTVSEILAKLTALRISQRQRILGLLPERADIIIAGTVILKCMMEYWGFKRLTVSEWDNLEGAIYHNLVKNDKNTEQNPIEKG